MNEPTKKKPYTCTMLRNVSAQNVYDGMLLKQDNKQMIRNHFGSNHLIQNCPSNSYT